VPELLLGDAPPPPKRRPRWLDAAGLAAVVAGILAIGVLGDRGSRDEAPPTTTTTTTPAVQPRPGPAIVEPAPRVTTAPIAVGRTLAEDTGTTLLVLGQSTPRLFDVDAGVLREVPAATSSDAVGVRGGFVLSNPNGLSTLAANGTEVRPFDAEGLRLGGQVVAAGADRVWVTTQSDDGGLSARELGTDGRPTGRQLSLPRNVTVEGATDDGLVVSQVGSVTFVDADGGSGRDLGAGMVVAVGPRTVARLGCHVLRCRLELVDVRTGRSQLVEDLPAVARARGAFSPSGRWLAAKVEVGNDRSFLVVIDVVGHRAGPGIEDGDAFAFAGRAAHHDVLFVAGSSRLVAYDLPDATPHAFPDLVLPTAQRLVAAPIS
jgi:hypothetical protein